MRIKPNYQIVLLLVFLLIHVLSLKVAKSQSGLNFKSNLLTKDWLDQEGISIVSGGNKSRIEQFERSIENIQNELINLKLNSCSCNHQHARRHHHHRKHNKNGHHEQNSFKKNTDINGKAPEVAEYGSGSSLGLGKSGRELSRLTRALTAEVESRSQASFFRGERGEPGRNGLDGVPGLEGAPGLDGVPGLDGRNGKDGTNGRDGTDGKHGQPGERGPPGPVGPPGELGKRGKQGPQGKPGPPGPAGVCAYKAKYDCSSMPANGTRESTSGNPELLLMAPTILGQPQDTQTAESSARQVTVMEGDNIQLSCEASGQPRPHYSWQRVAATNQALSSAILLDSETNFWVTSYAGSQLPLSPVDRLHAGSYECLASNGVPPDATKRINLDVNYKPTIRLFSPSFHQDKLDLRYKARVGSAILVECLVEGNPSPFTYWSFTPTTMNLEHRKSLHSSNNPIEGTQNVITESTGQLANGASYSIVTLNITNIETSHYGQYRCVSKNLIGQTSGFFWLDSVHQLEVNKTSDDKPAKWSLEKLDYALSWPVHLMERQASYLTFGNEHRHHQIDKIRTGKPIKPSSVSVNNSMPPLARDKQRDSSTKEKINVFSLVEREQATETFASASGGFVESIEGRDLCRIEKLRQLGGIIERSESSVMLLDQIGKPVYLGSSPSGQLDWWSVDAKLAGQPEANKSRFYATSALSSQSLFAYSSLSELAEDQQQVGVAGSRNEESPSRVGFKLNHRRLGSSQIVYNDQFIYTTESNENPVNAVGTLRSLMLVVLDLKSNEESLVKFADFLTDSLLIQPLNLTGTQDNDIQYQLNRVEILADENGIWLVLPTINQIVKERRLHVVKLNSPGDVGGLVDFHISMKLDWRMIGQMFIIDGVLYGIKDRHLYSSKLQFAYDLYKCKLLSTEYLNEPHRTFINHFGNTQMIKYNPNEPKRLYTIDNGNLLWCPVKLVRTSFDDIWQQQTNQSATNKEVPT